MAAIDVASMTITARIDTGSVPHPGSGATWEHDGVTYGASVHAGEGKVTVWDLETNEIVGSIPTAGSGLFIRTHEDTPYIWADAVFAEEPHAITVFEKAPPFKVVGVIDDGLRTLHPEFTADAKFVYISDWDGNVVRVYDATTLEKVAEVGGVTTPTGIFNTSRRLETMGHWMWTADDRRLTTDRRRETGGRDQPDFRSPVSGLAWSSVRHQTFTAEVKHEDHRQSRQLYARRCLLRPLPGGHDPQSPGT